jgi:hypothetical protein
MDTNDTVVENTIIPKKSKKIYTKKKASDQQCKEYNTLKYKTMIMTGNNLDINIENETDEDKLNNFLERDIQSNKKGMWSKLTKTEKIKKINKYIENDLKEKHSLSNDEITQTKRFINMLMERKKMSKNNDVDYDKDSGMIKGIDLIIFNATTRRFMINKDVNSGSLKSSTKKSSTKTKKNNE